MRNEWVTIEQASLIGWFARVRDLRKDVSNSVVYTVPVSIE
jgi:hypothetical protein